MCGKPPIYVFCTMAIAGGKGLAVSIQKLPNPRHERFFIIP